ncbi:MULTISPECIES: HD family phosphohydrolase [Planktothrix]|nr:MULTISPECIES: HDIG domain-containing metalloprotein [Planktothrix]
MNTLHALTQQIERLCSRAHPPLPCAKPSQTKIPTSLSSDRTPSWPRYQRRNINKSPGSMSSPTFFLVAVVSLTSVMGVRFYNQPKLDVGRVAPETIKAPWDASVPDLKTTDEKRKAAEIGAIPVLVIDLSVNQEIHQRIHKVLEQGTYIRKISQPFPFVDKGILSTEVQRYLRHCPEREWQDLLAQVEQVSVQIPSTIQRKSPNKKTATKFADWQQATLEAIRQQSLIQLKSYRRRTTPVEFSQLVSDITQARWRYAKALNAFSQEGSIEQEIFYTESFFEWPHTTWLQTQKGINQISQEMLAQGIAPGLPDEILRQAIEIQVKNTIPSDSQLFATHLFTEVLKANLVKDPLATRHRAELVAQQIEPVMVNINKGEIIVFKGEKITQQDFVLLDYFGLSERGINSKGLMSLVGLVSAGVGVVLVVEWKFHRGLRRRDRLLLLLLTLSTPIIILLKLPLINLPAVGLLVGSFYGSAVGATVVGLLSILLPIGMEIDNVHLLASAAGGLVGSLLAGQSRCREELALLGLGVGAAQGAVYLILNLMASATAGSIWYVLLKIVGLQVLEGIAWSIVALGLSPYLEHLFDLITPIRLAELANPNRPLLKRLAMEAPGTFQHTMFVANLAEAAAQELGCNVELVRTGTLYHDIGKMHDPLGFIENQMGGPNKHDTINDPWESTRIIKKHVSEGLVMAKKYRLPKAIQAFIPEHQGNMQIAYFYYQAQQQAKENPQLVVNETDFRYDGPIPQSRETGIVMLADSCEAALRSLKDASHEEALNMVNKILKARWQDNQLIDSGLTREEMSKIAEVFVRVWEQVNHKRIAYPKAALTCR